MKWHVLLLVVAILLGCVAADAGKWFGKMSKAYKAHEENADMGAEMAPEELPEMMAPTGEDDAMVMDPMMEPMMEETPPMMQTYARDHRYNPFFGHYYVHMTPYGGAGFHPYGGVVYTEHPLAMEVNEMRDEGERNPHPNVIA